MRIFLIVLAVLLTTELFADCSTDFELDSDGSKMLTKECCESAPHHEFETCIEKVGAKIASRGVGHNDNSKDKRFYRCAVTLRWKDEGTKKSWVKDPANLKACAEERKILQGCIDASKGTMINSSFLGFCAGDIKAQQCALGNSFFCK